MRPREVQFGEGVEESVLVEAEPTRLRMGTQPTFVAQTGNQPARPTSERSPRRPRPE